jgi:hypothetical protein
MPFVGRAPRDAGPSGGFLGVARSVIVACLVLLVSLVDSRGARATLRITDDHGGNIGTYWSRYMAAREANEQVIIDGKCSSACTLVLGIVPTRRICVTKNAVLGFHAAWRPGFLGFHVASEPGTRTLLSFYPLPIRQWIARNGGLTDKMLYLSGGELMSLYRECR